jgi:hypothetical protein
MMRIPAVMAQKERELISERTKAGAGGGVLGNWENWCRHTESNCGPTDYESVALPLSYAGITDARL